MQPFLISMDNNNNDNTIYNDGTEQSGVRQPDYGMMASDKWGNFFHTDKASVKDSYMSPGGEHDAHPLFDGICKKKS